VPRTLLWLFPLTYAVHVAEELWGGEGFPAWVARVVGAPLPVDVFVTLNVIGLTLMAAGVVLACRDRAFTWIAVAIAAVVALNGIAHAAATLMLGVYSPGAVSGLLLWLPLGAYTLARTRRELRPKTWTIGLLIGIAIHAIVTASAAGAALSSELWAVGCGLWAVGLGL
jgi:hypothetical protein